MKGNITGNKTCIYYYIYILKHLLVLKDSVEGPKIADSRTQQADVDIDGIDSEMLIVKTYYYNNK